MKQTIPLTPRAEKITIISAVLLIAGVFSFSAAQLELDFLTFFARLHTISDIGRHFLTLDMTDFGEIATELFLSISIALASLAFGTAVSFVLACLGAANIAPVPLVSIVIKVFVSILRAIPSLVWILMIVASLGFGPIAGVIGLIFPTVGYLTKSFISSIEDVPPAILETMQAVGGNWFQLIFEGVLPYVSSLFLTWIAIRLESNVAESISLGMVGAGGIGTLLTKAIGSYNYGRISIIILTIFTTMVTFELLVNQFKKKLSL